MSCVRAVVFAMLPLMLIVLYGCGGGSRSDSFHPVPANRTAAASSSFSNTSSAAGKYAVSFTVDPPAIDANNGQVLATATVISSNGANVSGLPVTFSVAVGPAAVVPSLATVSTDSNGKAMTVIVPGDVFTTTNVILMATATINGTAVHTYASFQIVRGRSTITFITTKPATDPSGTLYTLRDTVEANLAGVAFQYMQQLPFKVTDANGNPRVGVPVTLSIENQLTGKASLVFRNPTVVTDSAGSGIFNVGVVMTAPPQGTTATDSIIYHAVTAESVGIPSVQSYAGFVISMTTKNVQLALTPNTASFGTAADISFTISGGLKPYAVSSSNPARVSAALQPDGVSVKAHLEEDSEWTGTVTISISDGAGNTTSATLSK